MDKITRIATINILFKSGVDSTLMVNVGEKGTMMRTFGQLTSNQSFGYEQPRQSNATLNIPLVVRREDEEEVRFDYAECVMLMLDSLSMVTVRSVAEYVLMPDGAWHFVRRISGEE